MLHTTRRSYGCALNVHHQTAQRRLMSFPFVKGRNGEHFHQLVRVLPTVKDSERARLPDLFATASRIETEMPEDAEGIAEALQAWIVKDADSARRLDTIRRDFGEALARSVRSSELLHHAEYLRKVLILEDAVLRHVVLHEPAPEMSAFALHFAILNAIGELT